MLVPLPYHRAVRDHLKAHAGGAWAHFNSDSYQTEHTEELRLALLKATYRLSPPSHPGLYAAAEAAAEALGIEVPIELYQADDREGINAALFFVPDAARVVLHGPLEQRLDANELRALFGHELAHHILWTADQGELFTSTRALAALAEESAAAMETLRLHNLATEVFADRGAIRAAGALEPAIRLLIKAQTGLEAVDPEAFIRQADEVLARSDTGSQGLSHPEHFIRAKAMALHHAEGDAAEPAIARIIEGKLELDELDLLRRPELLRVSRDLVDILLEPPWFRSEAVVGHARLMFDDVYDDYAPATPTKSPEELAQSFERYGSSVLDYLAYLIVDFVAVDPDLDPLPLAQALTVAEALDLRDRVERFVNKELKITKKVIGSVAARRHSLLEEARSQ